MKITKDHEKVAFKKFQDKKIGSRCHCGTEHIEKSNMNVHETDTAKKQQLRIPENVLLFGDRPGQILTHTDVRLIYQCTSVQTFKPTITPPTQEIWESYTTFTNLSIFPT